LNNKNFKNNRAFGEFLESRTENFSLAVIRLSILLPNTPEGKVFKNQFTKSTTSTGANYREANRAGSNGDFKNKIRICESEASETVYWLNLMDKMNWIERDKIDLISGEAGENLALFASISIRLHDKNILNN